MIIFEAF